jgi:hypothetical protein
VSGRLGLLTVVLVLLASTSTAPAAPLPPEFRATNPSVQLSDYGVTFGMYPDGALAGGDLEFDALDGVKLKDIHRLVLDMQYSTSDNNPAGAPTAFLYWGKPGRHETNGYVKSVQGSSGRWDVLHSPVQVEHKAVLGPAQPWSEVLAQWGDQPVYAAFVSVGFTGGLNLTGLLRDLEVNDRQYCFHCPPAQSRPVGFVNWQDPVLHTAAPREPVTVTRRSCTGDRKYALRAPKRTGMRLTRITRVWLNGDQVVDHKRRKVIVDLRGRDEGEYTVDIIASYRAKGTGRAIGRVSHHTLNINC